MVISAPKDLEDAQKTLLQAVKENERRFTKNLLIVQNRLYSQLESLSWLQKRLAIKGDLPPLRGWAASPDVLLRLHKHVMTERPQVVVEFGSGVSTLVIADALRQNGAGKLISVEHLDEFGSRTLNTLQAEQLGDWVDLRVGDLSDWDAEHLSPEGAEQPLRWYPISLLEGVESVDLVWVDGPPASTCSFSRYPALPALIDKLSPRAEVWMDDTIRGEEREICDQWASDFGFSVEYYPCEKGLGRLRRGDARMLASKTASAESEALRLDAGCSVKEQTEVTAPAQQDDNEIMVKLHEEIAIERQGRKALERRAHELEEQVVQAQDAHCAAMRELNDEIASERRARKSAVARIQELEASIEDRVSDIAALTEMYEKIISSADSKCSKLSEEIDEHLLELSKLKKYSSEQEKNLRKLLNSTSWKITAPARKFVDTARQYRKPTK